MIFEKNKRQKVKNKRQKTFVLCLLFFIFHLPSCQKKQQYFFTEGQIFHTSYHIKYEFNRELGREIQAVLDSFDLSLNPFNPQSVISGVNNNRKIEVDDWFIAVFNKAREVSSKSGGAFDITCAPLVNLWGFGFNKKDSVTPEVIDSLKAFVDYRKIRLEGRKIVKDDPRILLNASAIAKGYACDVVAGMLESYGVINYMVEIGGEVHTRGVNPLNECWRIEITKPDDDRTGKQKERQIVIELCNKSLATSGNYRNYYIKDGKKYAHTIDPRTGYPTENSILSATVIASDCMTADAYATAFMVLGPEEAPRIGDQIYGLSYYLIYADSKGNLQIKHSPDLDNYIK